MNFYASKERIVGGGLLLEYNYRLAVSNLLTNYPKILEESEIRWIGNSYLFFYSEKST